MKRFYLLVLLAFSLSVVACSNASTSPIVPAECSLEIENVTYQEAKICVGQVRVLDDGTSDWDSIGTPSKPTENRFKFLPVSKVQNKETIKIFGYPDEGYKFFVWAYALPDGPGNGFGVPKHAKKVSIYLNQYGQIRVLY